MQDPPRPLPDLPGGTAVLIAGPSMTGKYDLLLRSLSTADSAILVSTGTAAETVREDYAAYGDPDSLAVVDCATRNQRADVTEGDLVRYVSSAQNLTEIGVRFTGLVEELEGETDVRVGIHSLSELLIYWDAKRVYQFVRVLLGQTRDLDWTTLAVLDDAAQDDRTVRTLTEPFHTLVNTRRGEDGPEYQLHGEGAEDDAWRPF